MSPLKAPKPKPRCRPLRRESDEHLWFVTSRVLEERFLLHPILSCAAQPRNRKGRRACQAYERHCDKRLVQLTALANRSRGAGTPEFTLEQVRQIAKNLVLSALARAQQMYGTKVYCVVVMSNHVHLVCQTSGKNLAAFMGYFKARVTETVNMLTGRSGPLWARRYDAQAIVDDSGVADRVGYSLNNPAAANLVQDPEQWPGLNLAYGFGDADRFECTYFDRTRWQRKKRPKDLTPLFKTATLTLSPAPSCDGMPREVYYQTVRSWIAASHEESQAKKAEAQGAGNAPRKANPLGVDKVLHASFDQRSRNPSRKKRPYAFGLPENVRAYNHGMFAVMAAFDDCADKLRHGELDVVLPDGTYRPPLMQAA